MKPDADSAVRSAVHYAADEVVAQIRLSRWLGRLNDLCVEKSEEADDRMLSVLSGLDHHLEEPSMLEPALNDLET